MPPGGKHFATLKSRYPREVADGRAHCDAVGILSFLSQSPFSSSSRPQAGLLVLAATLCGPLLVRIALLVEQPGALSFGDSTGLISDLSIALIFAAVLGWAIRLSTPLALILSSMWSLLQYANYEHVKELGAGLQFTFAQYVVDPAFLRGSVLSPTQPLLLAVILILPLLMTWLATRMSTTPPHLARYAVAGGVLAIVVQMVPAVDELHTWRQRHFVHERVAELLLSPNKEAGGLSTAIPPQLAADLRGEPRIPLPGSASNVILLILEGIPGTVLHSSIQPEVGGERLAMPRLREIAQRSLVADNFVLHQRQTNRGMYSLLCGDYPKLDYSLAKMTAYLEDSSRDCLPRVLGNKSYRTVYVQGAPLSFMYKDSFGRAAGFDRVYGNKDFEDPIYRSFWGVDDRTLLRQALALTRELSAADSPFFLTLLTVGTHHPRGVVPVTETGISRDSFAAAVDYLDSALGEFVSELDDEGLLDDTLLIITSDESHGARRAKKLRATLSTNWGPLVMVLPERQRLVIDAPYGQSDIALSILDYLGIDSTETDFIGRSVFREYHSPRRVYFGNLYLRQVGGVDGAGFVFRCDAEGSDCSRYRSDPSTLFLPQEAKVEMDPLELVLVREAIQFSLQGTPEPSRTFAFELVGDRTIPLVGRGKQILMGGQNLHIPKESRLDIDIVAGLEGSGGPVRLKHELRQRDRGVLLSHDLGEVRPGESIEIRYSYATNRPMRSVKLWLTSAASEPGDLKVHFERARALVGPLAGDDVTTGIIGTPSMTVHEAEDSSRGG